MKLIAETAWHHEGDFKFMKQLLKDIVFKTEADFVKLHILLSPNEYYFPDFPSYKFFNDRSFTLKEWEKHISAIMENGKRIMLLLNDSKAVEFGMKYEPELVEIHSVCLNDLNLLDAFKQNISKKTKIVLGIGGNTLDEIEHAINYLEHKNIILMFGFQNYPTQYKDINFMKIRRIMNLFPGFEFGYADHCSWNESNNILITLFGAALGMNYIEKHVTNRYGIKRCDWNSAISIEMFNELKNKIHLLEKCNGDGLLKLNSGEKKYSVFGPMKKAAFLNTDLKAGEILTRNMIVFKRTYQKSKISQLGALELLRKIATKNIKKNSLLDKHFFE